MKAALILLAALTLASCGGGGEPCPRVQGELRDPACVQPVRLPEPEPPGGPS